MNDFTVETLALGRTTAALKTSPEASFGIRLLEDDEQWRAEITITVTGQYPTTYKMPRQATQLAAWYSATSHLEVRMQTMRPPR